MALEQFNGNISDLVLSNPTGLDPKSQGDDHLRGIKKTLVQSFGNYTKKIITSLTGALNLPVGTTAQRDTTPEIGSLRYNTTLKTFEGNGIDGWGSVGTGQMYGTAAVKAIFYNSQNIGENISVVAGQNGLTAGPVTVDDGFSVDVANGSVWTVV